jgi:AraC family transcriptional regulator of arabinose operon
MDQRVNATIALIERDLPSDVGLSELARRVNLSRSRLRHLFKSETGKSPSEYRKTAQLLRAKTLIETTHFRIKEVMSQVGLKDQSHFSKDFKRTFGVLPTELRK